MTTHGDFRKQIALDDTAAARELVMQNLGRVAEHAPSRLSEEIGRFYTDIKGQGIEDPLLSQLVMEYAKAKMRLGC